MTDRNLLLAFLIDTARDFAHELFQNLSWNLKSIAQSNGKKIYNASFCPTAIL
jgi:hypothetical protein